MADVARSGISSIGFSLIWPWQGKPQTRTVVSRDIKKSGKTPNEDVILSEAKDHPTEAKITHITLCDPPAA
jgi:hypothetical protein